MPLYTYVMTYEGQTKVFQERRSNYSGWIVHVVGTAFPGIGKKALALIDTLLRAQPLPIASAKRVW